MRKLFLVPILALLLVGCASQSIEQELNTGAQIHAAATRSVRTALDGHLISSKDAEAYQAIAVNSSAILDSAKDLKDSDPSTAEGKVKLANDILAELQAYLVKIIQEKQP
jgi:hypothetical protein